MKKGRWSKAEVSLLTDLYADTPTQEIADRLGRKLSSVCCKAGSLGLRKSKEYMAGPHASRLRRGANLGFPTRFKKGHVPWNKGVKGSVGHHPNSRKTQFKTGHLSGQAKHNYLPVGSLRINADGHLQRKVTDNPDFYPAKRWVSVTRLVWEQAHGPIPKGHIVRFKPGMSTTVEEEITLDRIECISRSENMRRNTLHRYPKEIVDAIRSRAVLNRRINHVEKHD